MKNRTIVWLGGLLFAVSVGLAVARAADEPPQHEAVLNKYCTSCHNDRMRTGGLSLANLDPSSVGGHVDVWERVVRKLRTREMPPAGVTRPDDSTYRATASALEQALATRAGQVDDLLAGPHAVGRVGLVGQIGEVRLRQTLHEGAVDREAAHAGVEDADHGQAVAAKPCVVHVVGKVTVLSCDGSGTMP